VKMPLIAKGLCCQELRSGECLRFIGRIFRLLLTLIPFDAFSEVDFLELSGSYLVAYKKTRMAGLQSGEGRMMIDSVVWAQYINVTDTQTATSP